jgi:hypothetical protein
VFRYENSNSSTTTGIDTSIGLTGWKGCQQVRRNRALRLAQRADVAVQNILPRTTANGTESGVKLAMLRKLARRLWFLTPLGRAQAERQRVLARLRSYCSQDVRPRPWTDRQSTAGWDACTSVQELNRPGEVDRA